MSAVHVRVRHQYDLAVTRLLDVETTTRASADHLNDRRTFGIVQHVGYRRALHVEDFSADGQQRLEVRATRHFCGPERAVSLNDKQFSLLDVVTTAVSELGWQR